MEEASVLDLEPGKCLLKVHTYSHTLAKQKKLLPHNIRFISIEMVLLKMVSIDWLTGERLKCKEGLYNYLKYSLCTTLLAPFILFSNSPFFWQEIIKTLESQLHQIFH